jgi:outer membrane protein OmpA-like peptidoglycan-associated protein
MKRYQILVIAVAVAGCSATPFFSSKGGIRNPVPKPDWEQADSGVDSKSPNKGVKEKKRTPSVVWLPENRVLAKSIASSGRKVTDSSANPIDTGFGDCLRTGYNLLEGVDCEPMAEVANESSTDKETGNVQAARFDTDLLGDAPGAAGNQPPYGAVNTEEILTASNDPIDSPPSAVEPARVTSEVTTIKSRSSDSMPARLVPATYERVVLASDVLFDFAKFGLEGLTAEKRSTLAGLLERFAKYDATSLRKVIITGHSDRIGKPEANVIISTKRAETVKAFLIRAGIDTDILEVAGVGSVSPIKHCMGKAETAILKECLAPNRRVEIEIIGAT